MRFRSTLLAFLIAPVILAQAGCREAAFKFIKPECGSGRPAAAPALALQKPSITVFPVRAGGVFSPEITNVVGVMLERAGLEQIETETAKFAPDSAQELPQQAAAFASFVARHGIGTDYALLAEFVGSPKEGVKEVRAVLADHAGQVRWQERQRPGQPAFDGARPTCPMDCVVLLVRRLGEPLGIEDPLRPGAPEGKLAKKLERESGLPSQAERDAMAARLGAIRAAESRPCVKVLPSRAGKQWSAEAAEKIAARLNELGVLKATAEKTAIEFTTAASPNEQRVLWSGAGSIRDAVRKAPRGTDYLLFTDFLMAAEGRAGAVHTYLVAPDGEMVAVDFQNEHHDDFSRISPKTALDCAEVAAVRIAGRLR
jgi:hypothetical protein